MSDNTTACICKPFLKHTHCPMHGEVGRDEPTDLLTRLESDVSTLPEREITPDEACGLIDKIDGAIRRAKAVKEQLEAFLIEWMPQHSPELRINTTRYWIGVSKTEKCLNNGKCVNALIEKSEGDFDKVCDCLKSDAIKHGAARKMLGDDYKNHFETRVTAKLKNYGKPEKSLQSLNEAFLR